MTKTEKDWLDDIGVQISWARQSKGLTQKELGKICRVGERQIQKVESGQNMTLLTLQRVATALGSHPATLLETDPPEAVKSAPRKRSIRAKP